MLKDILIDLAALYGIDLSNTNERNLLVIRVNHAARELHDKRDIPEALSELVADIDQYSQQVALPNYVYSVRAMRYYDSREKIDIENIKNRYHDGYGGDCWPLKFRQTKDSPICREIANLSTLVVTIPLEEEEEFSVTISGQTEHSTRDSETLVFSAGDTEKETTLNFKDIESIVKSKATKYDVTITDADDNVVAIIPNVKNDVSYKIFQLTESDITGGSTYGAVEVLYLTQFMPAQEDSDTFWGTDKYDRTIIFKYRELYGEDDLNLSVAYGGKADKDLLEMHQADKPGKRERINFKPQPYFDLPYVRTGELGIEQ